MAPTPDQYIHSFSHIFPAQKDMLAWQVVESIQDILNKVISGLREGYSVQNGIAIHKTAVVEQGVILKAPVIVGENCFIGANAYLRGGVYLGKGSKVGTGCEVKSSIIMEESAIAHFNFIGDSLIGSEVNFEAGSIIANHYNERKDRQIRVLIKSKVFETGLTKFGALVGDRSKIGANAVLSPGTILEQDSIVRRLELVEQIKE